VGYEVWAELVLREPDQHHRKGWHPTGIFGAIGATAACARLAGLSSAQAATALAIAASHSSGLMANFGSMTKPLHAGRAAHTGVIASQLAEAGFTAASDALEHAQGLMRAVSPEGRADLASPIKAGKDWHILRNGINIKQYPTCFSTHRGLDGMRELMDAHRFAAGDVERLHISMSRRNALILRNHRPRTALEGKFSIEFALAAMLVAGKLTLSELDDAFVCSPEVQTLIEKVEIVHDDREDAVTGYAPYDELTVHMRDGSRLSTRVSDTGGSSAKPLSSDELFSKFSACLDAGGFTQDASAFFGALSVIDQDTGFHAMFERWLES
jgi:2-methylcitrate dehydratase PrpD